MRHGWGRVVYEDGRVEEGYWEYGVFKDGNKRFNEANSDETQSRLYLSGESKLKRLGDNSPRQSEYNRSRKGSQMKGTLKPKAGTPTRKKTK